MLTKSDETPSTTTPLGHHVMMRLADSRVIAADPRALRSVAVSILTVGRPFPLVVFRAVDTHIHAVLGGSFDSAGEFARRVEISMQRRLKPGIRFSEVHRVPLTDQRHLVRTFWYDLRNAQRHGADFDPLFEASNLPDLLGWRVLGHWSAVQARQSYPRLSEAGLLELLPVRVDDVEPMLGCLRDAAEAAVGFPPGGLRKRAPSRRQRGWGRRGLRAAVHAAPPASTEALAAELGVSVRTIGTLRAEEPDDALVAAVRGQVRFRSAWKSLQRAQWA